MSIPSPSQLLLGGISEIIGADDLTAICQEAEVDFSAQPIELEDLTDRIFAAIFAKYGERGGKGIVFRSGSVFGKRLRHIYGKEMGLESEEYRYLSAGKKIYYCLEKLAEKLSRQLRIGIEVEGNSEFWIVSITPGASASLTESRCQLVTGVMYDYLIWAGSGKVYPIEELGPFEKERSRCLVRISKHPLEA